MNTPTQTPEQLEQQTVEAFTAWRKNNCTELEFLSYKDSEWKKMECPVWCSYAYRIKPTPSTIRRPFTQVEAMQWRLFKSDNLSFVTTIQILLVNVIKLETVNSLSYEALMNYQCSNDGITWHPCWVEEKQ